MCRRGEAGESKTDGGDGGTVTLRTADDIDTVTGGADDNRDVQLMEKCDQQKTSESETADRKPKALPRMNTSTTGQWSAAPFVGARACRCPLPFCSIILGTFV